jgi:glucoamylase
MFALPYSVSVISASDQKCGGVQRKISAKSPRDGWPFEGWGKGRVWPLLTGERAHYELAAGRDITDLIKTYERFATGGQMMPEQVWDETNLPGSSQRIGQPTGSAVPLVWAHAEYLKLLRSAVDGKVFDRIDTVYDRYCTPEGRQKVRNAVEIYSQRRPVESIPAGKTLRILDEKWFEVRWSVDGWQTFQTAQSRNMGSAGFSADVHPEVESGTLQWTFHWLEPEAWLGRNVEVKIEAQTKS